LNKTVNLIVGYQNGTILLTDVDNFGTQVSLSTSDESINKLEWNFAVIWIITNSYIYKLDPK
jgi:hypothetical protein